MQIAAEHDISKKTPERIRNEGYLVSAYPAEMYHRCLDRLFVALINDEIAGFTLTFYKGGLPPEVEKDKLRIETIVGQGNYFLIKQVGVAIKHQKRGVGRAMYNYHLHGLEIPAFAPIVINPEHRNITSVAFHEALEFRQTDTLLTDEGRPISGLWRWDPPQPN